MVSEKLGLRSGSVNPWPFGVVCEEQDIEAG
jgi:hypothetical protein